jgi:DNA-binding transcriptional regulator LsrR (DeoR family)
MADAPPSDERLILAARLYYVDGLVQSEVARLVNVSQAKVSRLLALARERGIVRITVPEYQPRDRKLEQRLGQSLGLGAAVVIKAEPGVAVPDLRRMVGYFAAPAVADLLRPGGVLAVAGGRTMQELVDRLNPPEAAAPLTVVQAMGNIDSQVGPYDALDLGQTVARRWDGAFLMLNTPAFLPDRTTRDRVLSLESVRSVVHRLGRADFALVGVGTPRNSVFVERGVLAAGDIDRLERRGAIGEVCGRFFDAAGAECDTPFRDRVVGIGLDDLRRVRQVVAVVTGGDRRDAILAAVRGGLIKGLVIDRAGAEALLDAA